MLKKLHEENPSFPLPTPGFKNGSVRKCHTYILNMAMLPASVQRRSLGHKQGSTYWANTYNNPNDPKVRTMVAQTIAAKVAHKPSSPSPKKTPTRTEPQDRQPNVPRTQTVLLPSVHSPWIRAQTTSPLFTNRQPLLFNLKVVRVSNCRFLVELMVSFFCLEE